LPKTETGKLKRFALRQMAQGVSYWNARNELLKLIAKEHCGESAQNAHAQRVPSASRTPDGHRFCSRAAGRRERLRNGMAADGRIVVTAA